MSVIYPYIVECVSWLVFCLITRRMLRYMDYILSVAYMWYGATFVLQLVIHSLLVLYTDQYWLALKSLEKAYNIPLCLTQLADHTIVTPAQIFITVWCIKGQPDSIWRARHTSDLFNEQTKTWHLLMSDKMGNQVILRNDIFAVLFNTQTMSIHLLMWLHVPGNIWKEGQHFILRMVLINMQTKHLRLLIIGYM